MKRKVKRYSAGDRVEGDYESTDDYKNLIAAQDRETAEASTPKMPNVGEPLKMASFGEAFKEARGRGDKTFEYMGKKYTTEMAGEKKTAGPTTAKTAFEKRAAKQATAREAAPKSPGLLERIKSAMANPDNPRLRRERAELAAKGMKKGGSVRSSASKRADGIAQRGKTRGRII